MRKEILLISENSEECEKVSRILAHHQFSVTHTPFDKDTVKKIPNQTALILADYDLIRENIDMVLDLQGISRACLILYGDDISSEQLLLMLQRGVYSFIPRHLMVQRLSDTVLGGLENRKAFIEILEMMDQLKQLNESLSLEKENLRKRNQELNFLNLLSRKVSYDPDWDTILNRMTDAGLEETLGYILFGILYRLGNKWNLAVHLPCREDKKSREKSFVFQIVEYFDSCCGLDMAHQDITISLVPLDKKGCLTRDIDLSSMKTFPLTTSNDASGYLFAVFNDSLQADTEKDTLMSTLSNILSLSLKNAQEYIGLKEAAVTDNLTGIYNRKGFFDFLKKEFSGAKRYKKPLSFVLSDMDDFKGINDTMGHQAGDHVLGELAKLLKKSIREADILARYGGDEFALLLPETSRKDAEAIMERILVKVENHSFEWERQGIKIKMSYGISDSNELDDDGTEDELIGLADVRLYDKKNNQQRQEKKDEGT